MVLTRILIFNIQIILLLLLSLLGGPFLRIVGRLRLRLPHAQHERWWSWRMANRPAIPRSQWTSRIPFLWLTCKRTWKMMNERRMIAGKRPVGELEAHEARCRPHLCTHPTAPWARTMCCPTSPTAPSSWAEPHRVLPGIQVL